MLILRHRHRSTTSVGQWDEGCDTQTLLPPQCVISECVCFPLWAYYPHLPDEPQ